MTDKEYCRMTYLVGVMKGAIDTLINSNGIGDTARRYLIDLMAREVNPVVRHLYSVPTIDRGDDPIALSPPQRNIET